MNFLARTLRSVAHSPQITKRCASTISIGRKEYLDKLPAEIPTLLKVSPTTLVSHSTAAAICSAVMREGKLPFQISPNNPMYGELVGSTTLPTSIANYVKRLEERRTSFIYVSGTKLEHIQSQVRTQFALVEGSLMRAMKDYESRHMLPFWAPTVASATWQRKVVAPISITAKAEAAIYSRSPLLSTVTPPHNEPLYHPAVNMLDAMVTQSLRFPDDVHSDHLFKVQYNTRPVQFSFCNGLSTRQDTHTPLNVFIESGSDISTHTIGQAILHLAASLVSSVYLHNIDSPFFNIGVISNSRKYVFVVFQLNSLDFLPGAEVKNEVWISKEMELLRESPDYVYHCDLAPLNHLYCMLAYIYKSKHSPLDD